MLLGKVGSYSTAVMCSVALHLGLVVLVVGNWVPEKTHKAVVTPKYIDAKLLQLKPKAQPPKKDNPAEKKKAAADAKKKAEARKKAQAEKRRKEQARKKAAAAKKRKQQEAEKQRKAAEEKKRLEANRKKQQEQDLLAALEDEEEYLVAENDEQIASSYLGLVVKRLEDNFNPPPSARRGMSADVSIRLVPTGKVVSVMITRSSGDAAFDQAVEQAIKKADQFPELKKMDIRIFERYFRKLEFEFEPEGLRL